MRDKETREIVDRRKFSRNATEKDGQRETPAPLVRGINIIIAINLLLVATTILQAFASSTGSGADNGALKARLLSRSPYVPPILERKQ
ncbi:hypothetical protein K0M31_007460 [Melipona bicolor]|uniref:Uncharacterized protein n=1 Tax=Melipona bicolor TaxID=60889 RepID=A0AA40GBR4_9HYME|nr:hypothetical protein K0M31_007460 [Melipona bicolor]